MLPLITLQPGQGANWPHQTGLDGQTPPQPAAIANRTASIDNYAAAFVNIDGNQTIFIIPKAPGPAAGQFVTVNVSMGATDASGTALPPEVQPVKILGPPPPPLAVTIVQPATPSIGAVGAFWPHDPGVPSVSF